MASSSGDEELTATVAQADSVATTDKAMERLDGDWAVRFIDDLIAANQFKTFLVSQGVEVEGEVLHGLAHISEKHQREMDFFVREERKRKSILRFFIRSPEDVI